MTKIADDTSGLVSIGQLAKAAGVSSRTIRYYEELGILPEPRRSPGGTARLVEDKIEALARQVTVLRRLHASVQAPDADLPVGAVLGTAATARMELSVVPPLADHGVA